MAIDPIVIKRQTDARTLCLRLAAMGVLSLALLNNAKASDGCESAVGKFVSVEGAVELERSGKKERQPASLASALCQDDMIYVGANSRAALALVNDAVLRLDQNTVMRLVDVAPQPQKRSLLELIIGSFKSFSRPPRTFAVNTPYLNGLIEGTEFAMRVEGDSAMTTVYEGKVTTSNERGKLTLKRGESALAKAGQAPQSYVLVNPRDAVQWTLHYPPVFAALGGGGQKASDAFPVVQHAFELAQRGDIPGALDLMERVPQEERNAQYHVYRASLLLNVGRVPEARADLDSALAKDPKAGLAYALRAIVAIVRNEPARGLADAEKAVALSRSSAARIALSYAQQAAFRIEEARDTMLSATREFPQDALAWARLGELWLMLGDRHRAEEVAGRALKLAPDSARAQLVFGYVALAAFKNLEAKTAFDRAIALESSDPLAHFGLGLARISDGQLTEGRRELEAAVALGSSNSLMRAYLGKAYFEERRYPLDEQQYDIAEELDPKDPTAYLYEGILKQSVNRPVEALKDIETSIAANDNRAVYRSRQLLDKDQAARGISLARVYNDLSFTQLGIKESAMSLATDPTNAAAHRFLSDTYRMVRRQEISRVSELLQAQLMQDVNINPIQPSVAETNLNIFTAGGPGTAGFDEYTPLFERNQMRFYGTGLGGTNDTFGGEAVMAGVYDRFSVSGGAFSYDTQGWRPNSDLRHKIYNFFAQAALTPEVNVQGEFRHRSSTNGDLLQNFDRNDFVPDLRRQFDETTARFGARISPDVANNFLFSFIYSSRREKGKYTDYDIFPNPFFQIDFQNRPLTDEKAYQVEGQYLYQQENFNVIAGTAYARVDQNITTEIQSFFNGVPADSFVGERFSPAIQDYRGYVYSNFKLPRPVTWTVGASYASYHEPTLNLSELNPKLGVQWDITDTLRLRGAFFRGIKPALASNRTIEPTQIAGFNQFFDDYNATTTTNYAGGINWQPLRTVYIGGEVTKRDFQQPHFISITGTERDAHYEGRNELLHRAYVYWTPFEQWAFRTELVYDRYQSDDDSTDTNLPRKVETFRVPVTVQYFHPSGFFAGGGMNYVDQHVRRSDAASMASGDSAFITADLMIGYRFPKRYGIATLTVQNLFDKDFRYQDDRFRQVRDEPPVGSLIPDRTIMGRFTVNF